MTLSVTELRANIYRLLDEVLETGQPLVIERKGQTLRIVADSKGSKLDRLVPRPDLIGDDLDDFVHMDWSAHWNPDQP